MALIFTAATAGMTALHASRKEHRRYLLETEPIAPRKKHTVLFGKVPGEIRGGNPMTPPRELDDPYFWMRSDKRDNKEVLKHLDWENKYTNNYIDETRKLGSLKKCLYNEYLSHLKETDEQHPYRWGDYLYYSRTVKGKSYQIYCRKKAQYKVANQNLDDVKSIYSTSGPEEVILDINKVAEGHNFCHVGALQPSPDHTLLAVAVDFSGDEYYEIQILDIATGSIIDRVAKTAGSIEWGSDNSLIFYTVCNETHRPFQCWRHNVNQGGDYSNTSDALLLQDDNEMFWMGISKTESGEFLLCETASKETWETHALDLRQDSSTEVGAGCGSFRCIHSREKGLKYEASHVYLKSSNPEGCWIIRSNKDGCKNFKISVAPLPEKSTFRSSIDPKNPPKVSSTDTWRDILPYDENTNITGLHCFKSWLVVYGRCDGFKHCWTVSLTGVNTPMSLTGVTMPEESCDVWGSRNRVFDTHHLRLGYTSLTKPDTLFSFDMRGSDLVVLKTKEVPLYNEELYVSMKTIARASDGREVPISLVMRGDLRVKNFSGKTGNYSLDDITSGPLHLYGYGSYGICIDPYFSAVRLSLLDRGLVFAIAHVRGGGEMGRWWYEDEGKYLSKKNTFTDFVACAEHLIEKDITNPNVLSIEGRSAGGLLMGAVVNLRPELFRACIAGVPFVDAAATMCDPSIPLTVEEWEEWGNPNEEKYYEYMLSYSPLQNIKENVEYPAILATGGLHDPRVQYWEPMKWVNALRYASKSRREAIANGTKVDKYNQRPILLKIEMSAGHFSASDRYKEYKEKAFDYAWLLDQLGLGCSISRSKM